MNSNHSELRLRNQDAFAIARIKQKAAQKGVSTSEYMRPYIKMIGSSDIIEDTEVKYMRLVEHITQSLELLTNKIAALEQTIEVDYERKNK